MLLWKKDAVDLVLQGHFADRRISPKLSHEKELKLSERYGMIETYHRSGVVRRRSERVIQNEGNKAYQDPQQC